MLHRVIESTPLNPTQLLKSMAQSTALHANVPYVGDRAIQPLINEALLQAASGNDIEALLALSAILFQQAYQTGDIALADRAFHIWSHVVGIEPDVVITTIATVMQNQEEP